MSFNKVDKAGRENWINDAHVRQCFTCFAKFGTFNRRHHCRVCGNIFCASCSDKRIYFTPKSREAEDGYVPKQKRACTACFNKITEAWRNAASVKQDAELARKEAEASRSEALALRIAKEALEIQLDTTKARLEENEARALLEQGKAQALAIPDLPAPPTRPSAPDDQVLALQDRITLFKLRVEDMERMLAEAAAHKAAPPPLPASEPSPGRAGAYLVFEEVQYGTLSVIWSRSHISDALAFAEPGVKVPEFKYARGGRLELCRELARDKKKYYMGWTMFAQICKQFNCTAIVFDRCDRVAIPAALWLHRAGDNGIRRVAPNQPFTTEGVDVVAATHRDNGDLGVPCMERRLFVERSMRCGHSITLDAKR